MYLRSLTSQGKPKHWRKPNKQTNKKQPYTKGDEICVEKAPNQGGKTIQQEKASLKQTESSAEAADAFWASPLSFSKTTFTSTTWRSPFVTLILCSSVISKPKKCSWLSLLVFNNNERVFPWSCHFKLPWCWSKEQVYNCTKLSAANMNLNRLLRPSKYF